MGLRGSRERRDGEARALGWVVGQRENGERLHMKGKIEEIGDI